MTKKREKVLVGTLGGIRRGIEKETIRTTPKGALAKTLHPRTLGSALTHPFITTDFAEAQLELITPAYTNKNQMFDCLSSLHHFVAGALPKNELLWAGSLPPVLPADRDITSAQYGSSHSARMKMRYRQGLANRYGKHMQTISGIHYNFSLPEAFWQAMHAHEKSERSLADYVSEKYFHLIRNVMRHGWVIPFLFGASPALDKSYLEGREHQLEPMGDHSFYLPWATSLRLSSLGYTNSEQSKYPINYDDKMAYSLSLSLEKQKLSDMSLTPSAMMLADMTANDIGYRELVQRLSEGHMLTHSAYPVSAETVGQLNDLVTTSLNQQAELEHVQELSFSTFLTKKTAITCDC